VDLIAVITRPNLSRQELRRGLRIEIYDRNKGEYLSINPHDYGKAIQTYAVPGANEKVFFKVLFR